MAGSTTNGQEDFAAVLQERGEHMRRPGRRYVTRDHPQMGLRGELREIEDVQMVLGDRPVEDRGSGARADAIPARPGVAHDARGFGAPFQVWAIDPETIEGMEIVERAWPIVDRDPRGRLP